MKRIILIGLLYISSYIQAMNVGGVVDYNYFFKLCKHEKTNEVKKFIEQNPTLDINYQNEHGTTPLLHAITWGKWDTAWYLLDTCNADKRISDKYGQTLFSKAVYEILGSCKLKKLVRYYSLYEINTLCKLIGFKRDMDNPAEIEDRGGWVKALSKALNNPKNINNQNNDGQTVLNQACILHIIPLIIRFLNLGADLNIKDRWGGSAYDNLNEHDDDKAPLFVVREAFNSGSCFTNVPALLISEILKTYIPANNCTNYIKQLYADMKLSECFKSPKACIWKPVCVDACKLLETNVTDEKQCLTKVMLLPQHKLTELNIQLLLADK